MNEPEARKKRSNWAACPNCRRNLATTPVGSRPPYSECPYCGELLTEIWWQRTLVTALGLILAFALPASFGITGLALLFAALVCYFHASMLAMILVFKVMQPQYVRSNEPAMTLFQRK